MAPLVEAFQTHELQQRIQFKPDGKRRKPAIKDLAKDCALTEFLQYSCNLNGPKEDPRSKVICEPVLRSFRRCANGLSVETTDWEDERGR